MVPFLVRAIIRAKPPKNAISTSRISGFVRAKSSEDSSLSGNNQKNRNAVSTLKRIITPKLINDFLSVSMSFMATDNPIPKIGPISGEISMAPMTTAVEFALSPIEATKIEQIKIQAVAPLNGMSRTIASMVLSRSVSLLKSSSSMIKTLILVHSPRASRLMAPASADVNSS